MDGWKEFMAWNWSSFLRNSISVDSRETCLFGVIGHCQIRRKHMSGVIEGREGLYNMNSTTFSLTFEVALGTVVTFPPTVSSVSRIYIHYRSRSFAVQVQVHMHMAHYASRMIFVHFTYSSSFNAPHLVRLLPLHHLRILVLGIMRRLGYEVLALTERFRRIGLVVVWYEG